MEGVDHLLYNLLVLGCVSDDHGKVWLRSPMDLYIVETMPLYDQQVRSVCILCYAGDIFSFIRVVDDKIKVSVDDSNGAAAYGVSKIIKHIGQ